MKEPDTYDFIFDSQQELSKLGSDTEGKYLASLLLGNKTVNIKTQNGAWQGNFYLPQLDSLYPENHLILYQRYAVTLYFSIFKTCTNYSKFRSKWES